ncbi:MAG: hypothetical protein NVS3B24_21000 [Candidatus Dormibacteria bacterium]
MVVEAAVQEDVDGIGISLHSGAHMTLVPKVMKLLAARNIDDIVVFVGGIIPDEDIKELKKLGVAEVFTPGTPLREIVEFVNQRFADRVTA